MLEIDDTTSFCENCGSKITTLDTGSSHSDYNTERRTSAITTTDINILLNELNNPSQEVRLKALDLLKQIGLQNPDPILKKVHTILKKGEDQLNLQPAFELVAFFQQDASVPMLLKILTNNSPNQPIFELANSAFLMYDSRRHSVATGLKQLLFHNTLDIQMLAVELIGKLQLSALIRDLISVKKQTGSPALITAIHVSFGQIGDFRPVPILLAISPTKESDLALQYIRQAHSDKNIDLFLVASIDELDQVPENTYLDPSFYSAIIEGIHVDNTTIRRNCFFLYCKNTSQVQFKEVLLKVQDLDPDIRKLAFTWLAQFPSKQESWKAFMESLDDAKVQETTSKLLEHPDWLTPLIQMGLTAHNPDIRGLTATILTHIDDQKAVKPMITAFIAEQQVPTKTIFAEALGTFGNAAALPSLLDARFQDHVVLVQTSLLSIAQIGKATGMVSFLESLQTLAGTLKEHGFEHKETNSDLNSIKHSKIASDTISDELVYSLITETQVSCIRQALAIMLDNGTDSQDTSHGVLVTQFHQIVETPTDITISTRVAEFLGYFSKLTSMFSLLEAEESEHQQLVRAASQALTMLGKNQEEKALIQIIKDFKHPDPSIRTNAIDNITQYDYETLLGQLLQASNTLIRASTILALGRSRNTTYLIKKY